MEYTITSNCSMSMDWIGMRERASAQVSNRANDVIRIAPARRYPTVH